jgi:CheY-like chemotaxis protein
MATVLVVDDSPLDRRLAGGILEKRSGLNVEYASNGVEALEKIQKSPPDAILSDLQMPELDGLELVGAIRSRYPLIPVILMTAHGSEDIAVQALARGASSYVPKAKLAQELPDVLESVLAVSKADRHNERLGECLKLSTNDFILDNDTALVYPLVDHCQRLVTRMRLCDETGRIRIGIALEEALLNALYHGNLELTADQLREARSGLMENGSGANAIEDRREKSPYRDRRIHFHVSVSTEEARFVIRDEGPGFKPGEVPDCTEAENLERESGRGLLLMRTFMDEVDFNPMANQVTLVKRRENKP